MQILSHILRLALLRVLADAGMHAGDWLSFVEIGDYWRDTGLRAADLRKAVNDLVDSGDLVASDRDGLLGYSLGGWARHSLHQPDGELQQASDADKELLLNARFRPRAGTDPGLRRRDEDQD
jgi:hypothetical protein